MVGGVGRCGDLGGKRERVPEADFFLKLERVEVNKKAGRKKAKWTGGRLSKWIR